MFDTPSKALKFYGEKRTHDHKGVTIPSQRRYVEYYGQLVTKGMEYRNKTILLKSLSISPIPTPTGGLNHLRIVAYQRKPENESECEPPVRIHNSEIIELKKIHDCFTYCLNPQIKIRGDIKIEIWNHPKLKKKERLCSFWFNTFFVEPFNESTSPVCPMSYSSSSAPPEYRSNSDSSISHSSLDPNWNHSHTNKNSSESSTRSSGFFNLGNATRINDTSYNISKETKDRLAVFATGAPTGSKLSKNGRSRFNSGPPPSDTGNQARYLLILTN